ncbi:hypothetical protein A3Q56_04128 [Intoshia linei]|uniref:General transcription factor 3C polypeptide 3 n=1 Tax=Intoshia linei TaxID=1819745 RepID=A0A177B3Y1_9BILA|nr:hypothetical protein A3Q56_04128 [Intoshia linei]
MDQEMNESIQDDINMTEIDFDQVNKTQDDENEDLYKDDFVDMDINIIDIVNPHLTKCVSDEADDQNPDLEEEMDMKISENIEMNVYTNFNELDDLNENKLEKLDELENMKMLKKLPPYLSGLLGQANMHFIRRQFDISIKIATTIIKRIPYNWEAYETIAQCYMEKGDTKKYFTFLKYAAYLNPKNYERWLILSDLAENKSKQEAVKYLKKALQIDNKDLRIHWRLCHLLEYDNNLLFSAYIKLLNVLASQNSQKYIDLVRDIISNLKNKQEESDRPVRLIYNAIHHHPHLTTLEEKKKVINYYFNKSYFKKCLQTFENAKFVEFFDVDKNVILFNNQNEYQLKFDSIKFIKLSEMEECLFPFLCISAIHNGLFYLAVIVYNLIIQNYLQHIDIGENVEIVDNIKFNEYYHINLKLQLNKIEKIDLELSEIMLKIANTFSIAENYNLALEIYKNLVDCCTYNQEVSLYGYGSCLSNFEQFDEAIKVLEKCIEFDTNWMEPRMCISQIYQNTDLEKAISYLTIDSVSLDNHILMYSKSKLFIQKKLYLTDPFCNDSDQIVTLLSNSIFGNLHQLTHNQIMCYAIYLPTQCISKGTKLRNITCKLSEIPKPKIFRSIVTQFYQRIKPTNSKKDLWDSFVILLNLLNQRKEYDQLAKHLILGLISFLFFRCMDKLDKIFQWIIRVSIITRNGYISYKIIRYYFSIEHSVIYTHFFLNLTSKVLESVDCDLYIKFVITLSQNPKFYSWRLLVAHSHLKKSNMINAAFQCFLILNVYFIGGRFMAIWILWLWGNFCNGDIFNDVDPLNFLYLGISLLRSVRYYNHESRHFMFIYCIYFFQKYAQLRGECQEVYFNIGRCMHYLEMKSYAVFFYNKALTFKSAIPNDEDRADPTVYPG